MSSESLSLPTIGAEVASFRDMKQVIATVTLPHTCTDWCNVRELEAAAHQGTAWTLQPPGERHARFFLYGSLPFMLAVDALGAALNVTDWHGLGREGDNVAHGYALWLAMVRPCSFMT